MIVETPIPGVAPTLGTATVVRVVPPPVAENRRNPLFFEKDGDFNPGWALFIQYAEVGAVCSVGAVVEGLIAKQWQPIVGALSFIGFAMIATAAIVVPIARAKLLVSLKSAVGEIGARSTVSSASSYFGSPSSYGGPDSDYVPPPDLPNDDLPNREREGDEPG